MERAARLGVLNGKSYGILGLAGPAEVVCVFSPEEAAHAYEVLLSRSQKALQQRRKERSDAVARLKAALAEVAPGFPVDRVYLFGSALTDRFFSDSDLDLAVEGPLSFEEMLSFWAELDGRLDRDVDVRQIQGLPFADRVRARGMVVYEREDLDAPRRDRGRKP